jgi:hypothetical protein
MPSRHPAQQRRLFPFGPTHQTTGAELDSLLAVNVKVPFFPVAELALRWPSEDIA